MRPGVRGVSPKVISAVRDVIVSKATWSHAAKQNDCCESAISCGLKRLGFKRSPKGFTVPL